jgi:putative DeoR family transcriptional regulator (stage III sporulation protein D)
MYNPIGGDIQLKGYIEERAIDLANFIIDKKTTVRSAAKKFGISKSTVHTVVSKQKGHYYSPLKLFKGGKSA